MVSVFSASLRMVLRINYLFLLIFFIKLMFTNKRITVWDEGVGEGFISENPSSNVNVKPNSWMNVFLIERDNLLIVSPITDFIRFVELALKNVSNPLLILYTISPFSEERVKGLLSSNGVNFIVKGKYYYSRNPSGRKVISHSTRRLVINISEGDAGLVLDLFFTGLLFDVVVKSGRKQFIISHDYYFVFKNYPKSVVSEVKSVFYSLIPDYIKSEINVNSGRVKFSIGVRKFRGEYLFVTLFNDECLIKRGGVVRKYSVNNLPKMYDKLIMIFPVK